MLLRNLAYKDNTGRFRGPSLDYFPVPGGLRKSVARLNKL